MKSALTQVWIVIGWVSLASPIWLLLSYLAHPTLASVTNKSDILATIFICLIYSPKCLEPRLFFWHPAELILIINKELSEFTA